MPNWCGNTLSVSGNKDYIKRFREQGVLKNDDVDTQLSLAKFVPEPNYEEVEVKPTFPSITGNNDPVKPGQSWWDWRVQNWGTKWDIDAYVNEESDEHIHYYFDSAWSPPVEWLEKTSKLFPDLRFKLVYREDGCAFMGMIEYEDGGVMDETQIDTSSVWDDIIKEGYSEEDDEAFDEYMNRLDALENEL